MNYDAAQNTAHGVERQKQHTARLKEVLREWRGHIPVPSTAPECLDGGFPIGQHTRTWTSCGDQLAVEREPLFNDLWKHLRFAADPERQWRLFKEQFIDYEAQKASLLRAVGRRLEKELELPVSDRWDGEVVSDSAAKEVVRHLLADRGRREASGAYLLDLKAREPRHADGTWEFGSNGTGILRRKVAASTKEEATGAVAPLWARAIAACEEDVAIKETVLAARRLLDDLEILRKEFVRVIDENLEVALFDEECRFSIATRAKERRLEHVPRRPPIV